MATEGTTPPQEASDEFHGDAKVSAVPKGEHEVTGGSEDAEDVQGVAEDVVQLASTSMKEQVNDFMIRASVALGVRTSDLEQQVQELTEKLSNKEEELEATRETLRGSSPLPTTRRLGSDPPSPSGVVSSSSLEEAVKLLEDLVSRIEAVSRSHATSLARSSVGFIVDALLSRGREKSFKALIDAVGADTRQFVQSQGPGFHSLVAQKQHGNDAANTGS
ncbi:unnamed protein product [Miscanthus lutarioriparius]|uniref:Uncharacterized protein n=1 Tax=Miscanthus lutarioriparius TaxID=422564 RepID=A0A811RZJ7_9POAL|nr:unnamed protein product [Miscanthus lutarioriparius]